MSVKIPRLEFHEMSSSVQLALEERVERLGYLGEFFKCSAHQPDTLTSFMQMTESLKKALPDRLTEVGALTVATLMSNKYELNQHERLSRRLGFGNEWVAAVEQVSPDTSPDLSDRERAVQALVVALIERRGKSVKPELERVIDLIGVEQAIAVMFLTGRYITHALIVNGLELEPPVRSIFEEAGA